MTRRKRTLSGIKPTGQPHLGNYLGMLKPALALQATHDTHYFIADYHALTTEHDPRVLRESSYELVATFAALGMDFDAHTFFRQSDVAEVTELAWILSCVTSMGLLERAHAFKDKRARNEEITHGLFSYPVLMAADILIYDADEVPVGQDQKQHLEMTRDIAQRFNHIFGETFVIPEARIEEAVATVPGLDGRKMSKSYGNQIPLFCTEQQLRKAVMRVVTDSRGVEEPKDPDTCNVFQIFRHFAPPARQAEWAARYRAGGMGYGEIKQATFEAINAEIQGYRARYFAIRDDTAALDAILAKGASKARVVAREVLRRARHRVGFA
ncbi:MAG: tryptophan--tRNA ligase [Candidatus Lambdaproteobacteria bacterium]|nr:tryptophan--tRNA ligase [Candidatus Lambdaproteobacteria bacterium]